MRQITLVAPDFLFMNKFTVITLWVVSSIVPSLLIFCYWATLVDLLHHTTTTHDEVSQTAVTAVITKSMDEFLCQYCSYVLLLERLRATMSFVLVVVHAANVYCKTLNTPSQ